MTRSPRARFAGIASVVSICASLVLRAAPIPQQNATADELKQAETEVPQLIKVLEIAPGMTVADVGAGGGAMTMVMARRVGPMGRVYATELNPQQVTAIRAQAAAATLENVVVVEAAPTATNLPDACCDAIYLRNVYHHLTDPLAEDRSLLKALKPGGRLAIIDFEPAPGSKPAPDVPADRTGHGVAKAIVARELRTAGFDVDSTIRKWPATSAGDASFLVLARRPGL